jgi:uncharacterized protein
MTDNLARIARFNLWDDTVPEAGFLRAEYLKTFSGFMGNNLIKVLTGQRRTGKSYLLRQVMLQLISEGIHARNILYINTEYVEFNFLRNYTDLDALVWEYRQHFKPTGKVYLFFDEIQSIEGWERAVNSYAQDFTTSYELFISGSNARMLAGELATLLSGRFVQWEILPFSFQEFAGFHGIDTDKKGFLQYLQTGGLPELYQLPNEETRRHYLSALKDTILLRDVVARFQIKDVVLLEDVFAFLVNNIGNLTSIGNLISYFGSRRRKTNYETVANYVGYLNDTFLLHKSERIQIKAKELMGGTCKYYLNDLSYKHYLYGHFKHGYGYLLENYVYLELRRQGYEVHTGYSRSREVDFVARKGDRTLYMQVAWSIADEATSKREYDVLNGIMDHNEKILVTADDLRLPDYRGIRHQLAWEPVAGK